MCNTNGLFEKKSIIGAKLEQILANNGYTKASFCKAVKVSRPTFDKILAGTVTSQTNYDKHISKILDFLEITPDELLGNVENPYNRINTVRNNLRITSDKISEATGISMDRLKEIESGAEATMAELRDIAWCLSTSVNSLLHKDFFGTQISVSENYLAINDIDDEPEMNGFWGYVGIMPVNSNDYLWYPITFATYGMVGCAARDVYIVIPCMNNKVLLVNTKNIKKMIFVDEAGELSVNIEREDIWVNIPPVFFEALEDYELFGQMMPTDVASKAFCESMDRVFDECFFDEEPYDLANLGSIRYTDGFVEYMDVDYNQYENITDSICHIYRHYCEQIEEDYIPGFLEYQDANEIHNIVYLNHISVMEFPLLALENAIQDKLDNDVM